MFQITILFLYIIAGVSLTLSRLPAFSTYHKILLGAAGLSGVAGLLLHAQALSTGIFVDGGLSLSIRNTASLIGLQLALIALLAALQETLRGLAGGLLLLAAVAATLTGWSLPATAEEALTWQIQTHVLISLFAYGLLTAGAIVALFALVQERRLRAGQLSSWNRLFSPLETTEKMLFGITTAGFLLLLLAVSSGFALFDNIFAQHLVHKTTLSLLALLLFGILIGGRQFAGWRGSRAVYLYLWGFAILCLAYFGSRYILEAILGRSWN
ncbi:MAG: cytochrome c biogenesis protein CcsA [Woeseiaceae bacterium]|nr:cytochrome c biogenesis protein CcsA [Woeseiaceae bacterium]